LKVLKPSTFERNERDKGEEDERRKMGKEEELINTAI
jgi:hypothetical protein